MSLSKVSDVLRYGELAGSSVFIGTYLVIDKYLLEKVLVSMGFLVCSS